MKRIATRIMMVLGVTAVLLGNALNAQAFLIGDTIHGSLSVEGYSANFFDPVNGLVPAGSSGIQPTAVVTDPDVSFVEFMFGVAGRGGLNLDVDDTSITLDLFLSVANFTIPSLDLWLTDLDQTGHVAIVVDEFPGGLTVTTAPHAIHISTHEFTLPTAGAMTAQLNLLSNPEPGTIVLLGTGLLGIVGYGWRRKYQMA